MIEDQHATEPAPATLPRPWWRTRPALIGAALALAAAGTGIGLAATSTTPTIQIHGVLTLGPLGSVDSASGTAANGDPCQAGDGYTDITPGAGVVVGNATGQTIGTGRLQAGIEANVDDSAGTPLGNCAFQFTVTVPAGEGTYTVTISHRGTQTLTADQVKNGILLTLGD